MREERWEDKEGDRKGEWIRRERGRVGGYGGREEREVDKEGERKGRRIRREKGKVGG